MKISSILLIVPVLVIVLVFSGCTGQGQKKEATSGGLVITDFISDVKVLDAGEEANIEVDFDNLGEETASDVQGVLIRKGAFTVEPQDMQTLTADLEPPITDTPSSDAFVWQLTAPEVTQERTEEVQARVFYKYTTQGFGTINFVPLNILREKGEAAFPLDLSSSLGPISIDAVADQPKTLRSSDPQSVSVRLTITISNIGSGRVENETLAVDEDGKTIGGCSKELDCIDNVLIEGFGASCLDVSDVEDVSALTDDEISALTPLIMTLDGVRLIEGNEGKITKTVNLYVPDAAAATSCQIRVTANYRYRVDSNILGLKVIPVQ